MISKRNLITGAGALFLCTPAIVRASSLMQIRGVSFSLGGTLNSDETQKLYSRIDRLKDGLKADGLWDKLEVLWLFDTDPPTQIVVN